MRLFVVLIFAVLLTGCAGPVATAAALAPDDGPRPAQAVPTPAAPVRAAPVPITRPTPARSDVLITYTRSGGLAGFADSYAIRSDGSVAVVAVRRMAGSSAGGSVLTVAHGAAAMQQLIAAIAATGLYDQAAAGPAPQASGDRISYDVTIQHDQQVIAFTVVDGANQPAVFQHVLVLVQQYIHAAQAK